MSQHPCHNQTVASVIEILEVSSSSDELQSNPGANQCTKSNSLEVMKSSDVCQQVDTFDQLISLSKACQNQTVYPAIDILEVSLSSDELRSNHSADDDTDDSQQQVNTFDDYLNELSVKSHEQGNNVLWNLSKAEFCAIVGLCTHDEAYRIQRQKSTERNVKRLRRISRRTRKRA